MAPSPSHVRVVSGVALFFRDERKCAEDVREFVGGQLIERATLALQARGSGAVVAARQPPRQRGDLPERAPAHRPGPEPAAARPSPS